MIQISSIATHHQPVGDRDRKTILPLPAHRQHRHYGARQGQFLGNAAPAQAQHHGLAPENLCHAVFHRPHDGPVVQQETLRDPLQRRQGMVIVEAQGRTAAIGAGGNHGETKGFQEEMMQGAVGQQGPEPIQAGGQRGAEWSVRSPRQQHDGCERRLQQRRFRHGDITAAPQLRQIGKHHRQGLGRPRLARPQSRYGRPIPGIHQQMDTADALDRHDATRAQRDDRLRQRRIAQRTRPTRGIMPGKPWSADRAGQGLGMKPPIGGIGIFRPAIPTQCKTGHGGVDPVERQVLQDGPAWPAVAAGGEGITIAACSGIEQLRPAGRAGGEIGSDRSHRSIAGLARCDDEGTLLFQGPLLAAQAFDSGGWWNAGQFPVKAHHGRLGALDLHDHPAGCVGHPAGQAKVCGQPMDERPQSHPLHPPMTGQTHPSLHPRVDHEFSGPRST
jgi:hypothetical protein